MAENTKIEWATHTFNPVVGCTKVSPACDHCYAESWAKRAGSPELWQGKRRRTTAANWRKPIAWDREAGLWGRRDRVFCASLADVFDNQWEPEWRADLWAMIASTPNLDWLLLTKRPQNIRKMLPPQSVGWPWHNVWLGTTVENQEEADRRIPHLLSVPARIRFLSCEPLLEPLTIFDLNGPIDVPDGMQSPLHWIICGGESGGNARYMEPDWARSLRDQCADARAAFFMKQMTGKKPIPADLMTRQFPGEAG